MRSFVTFATHIDLNCSQYIKMMITHTNVISSTPPPLNSTKLRTIFAKKQGPSNTSKSQQKQQQSAFLRLKVPNVLLARSAIAVLGLGFIDAGYSGDWSRIGVISKDAEEILKIAAYVVVPLCSLLIFSLSKEQQDA